jgi:hypothetical protein
MTDKRVVAALETLGGDPGLVSYKAKLKAAKVWMAYGNKSSDKGTLEIFCDENVQKEYVLLPDQVYDESKSFAPCFEATLREIDESKESFDTNDIAVSFHSKPPSRVFPNPVEDQLQVFSYFPQEEIQLFTTTGRPCNLDVESNQNHIYYIPMKDLSPGVYLLTLGHEVHRVIKY